MFSFNFYNEPVEHIQTVIQSHDEEGSVRILQLDDVLALLPDTLAFSLLEGLPRRELWHVKMQLMQKDENPELLGQSDVITGLYEGGLKTWECSLDLARYLSQHTYPDDISILEVFLHRTLVR
jgi:protein-histidine N-methyltransferase